MCHRLSPINRDNVLSPDRVVLVTGIMEGDEIDVAKIIYREISDLSVRTNISLAFPYLLTQLCLDQGVPNILGMDQFSRFGGS